MTGKGRSFGYSRRKRTAAFLCLLVVSALATSCGESGRALLSTFFKDPDGEAIKAALKTNVPLAYSASVAMSAAIGTIPANAAVTRICSSYPCAAVVTIDDDDSAMPLQLGDFGTIRVYGYWTSSDQAVLTIAFGSNAGSSLFPIQNINLVPVSRTGSSIRMVYVGMDVNEAVTDPSSLTQTGLDTVLSKLTITASDEARLNLNMDAWVVETDTGSTAALSDDTYTLSGAGMYLSAVSGLHQLAMAQVRMAAGCALNPEPSGAAVLQEMDARSAKSILGQAIFGFPSTCDGTAVVLVGNGNYLLAAGNSIPLHLDSP